MESSHCSWNPEGRYLSTLRVWECLCLVYHWHGRGGSPVLSWPISVTELPWPSLFSHSVCDCEVPTVLQLGVSTPMEMSRVMPSLMRLLSHRCIFSESFCLGSCCLCNTDGRQRSTDLGSGSISTISSKSQHSQREERGQSRDTQDFGLQRIHKPLPHGNKAVNNDQEEATHQQNGLSFSDVPAPMLEWAFWRQGCCWVPHAPVSNPVTELDLNGIVSLGCNRYRIWGEQNSPRNSLCQRPAKRNQGWKKSVLNDDRGINSSTVRNQGPQPEHPTLPPESMDHWWAGLRRLCLHWMLQAERRLKVEKKKNLICTWFRSVSKEF